MSGTNGTASGLGQAEARQERVMNLLLTGMPVARAAKLGGVGVRTVYDWHDDPAFRERLQQRRHEVAGRLEEDLAELGRLAVAVVKDYLADEPSDNYGRSQRVKLATQLIADLGMFHARNRTETGETAGKRIKQYANGRLRWTVTGSYAFFPLSQLRFLIDLQTAKFS